MNILSEFDFSFYKPKKDKCVLCEMAQSTQNITESEKLSYTYRIIDMAATTHYMELPTNVLKLTSLTLIRILI
jgi:hypothetical protein